MKPDCLKFNDCNIPMRLCDDDCPDIDLPEEGRNPFDEEIDRGCDEYHFKKDMGEI